MIKMSSNDWWLIACFAILLTWGIYYTIDGESRKKAQADQFPDTCIQIAQDIKKCMVDGHTCYRFYGGMDSGGVWCE